MILSIKWGSVSTSPRYDGQRNNPWKALSTGPGLHSVSCKSSHYHSILVLECSHFFSERHRYLKYSHLFWRQAVLPFILEAEKQIGVRLPKDHTELLILKGGGGTQGFFSKVTHPKACRSKRIKSLVTWARYQALEGGEDYNCRALLLNVRCTDQQGGQNLGVR